MPPGFWSWLSQKPPSGGGSLAFGSRYGVRRGHGQVGGENLGVGIALAALRGLVGVHRALSRPILTYAATRATPRTGKVQPVNAAVFPLDSNTE
jgi:hypothetical protein